MIEATQYTPKSIADEGIKFKIPLYQRLFTWNNEKIKVLLEDLYFHFINQRGSCKIKPYYLGIITQIHEGNGDYTLVVDGQQRLTALMLMGAVFASKNYLGCGKWQDFLCPEKDFWNITEQDFKSNNNKFPLRLLPFAREDDKSSLGILIIKKRESPDEILNDDITSNRLMIDGVKEIDSFLLDMNRFGEYSQGNFIKDIYENLTLLVTSLDPSCLKNPAYLNKYFEIMNSNYKNLESHERLKIWFCSDLGNDANPNKDYYLNIWNKCEDISEPLSHQVRTQNEMKNEDESVSQSWENTFNSYFLEVVKRLNLQKNKENDSPSTYLKLFDIPPELIPQKSFVGKGSRSIITFPQFLLLALDIFIEKNLRQSDEAPQATNSEQASNHGLPDSKDRKTQFYNTGKLLETFGYHKNPRLQPEDIPHFFKFMLKLRALFDFYVIRRAEDTEDEYSILCCKNNDKSSSDEAWTPEKTECRLVQYQAMLRIAFTDTYYTWLKPYLSYLYSYHFPNNEEYPDESSKSLSPEHLLNWLKNWDNQRVTNNMTLYIYNVLIKPENFTYESRNRYAFLRLDYYLWENSADQTFYKKFFKDDQVKAVKAYRMRTNRSIEHVFPQNPESGTPPWDPKDLHSFGNLAMISNSLNSVQSNNLPHVKFARLDDQIARGTLESLKLLVMKNKEATDKWDENMAKEHGTEMIALLQASFSQI